MMNEQNQRPLTLDDMIGILIYRANQLAAYLGSHGVGADLNIAKSHLVSMYSDVELAQRMSDDLAARNRDSEPQQPTTN